MTSSNPLDLTNVRPQDRAISIALADGNVSAAERRNIRQTYGAQAARDLDQFQRMVTRAVQPVGGRSSRISERESRRLTRTVGDTWLSSTASQLARSMRLGTTPALEARQPARRQQQTRMAGQRDLGGRGSTLPLPSREDYLRTIRGGSLSGLTGGTVLSQGGRVAYGRPPEGQSGWVQSAPIRGVPRRTPNEGYSETSVLTFVRLGDGQERGGRRRAEQEQRQTRRQQRPASRPPAPAPTPFVSAPRAVETQYRQGISTAYGQSSTAFGHEDLTAARNAGYSDQEIRSWLDANPGTLRGTNRPGQGGLYDELRR